MKQIKYALTLLGAIVLWAALTPVWASSPANSTADKEARSAMYQQWMYSRLYDPVIREHIAVVSRISQVDESTPADPKPGILSFRCEDGMLQGLIHVGNYVPEDAALQYRLTGATETQWADLDWKRTWFRRGLESNSPQLALFVALARAAESAQADDRIVMRYRESGVAGAIVQRTFALKGLHEHKGVILAACGRATDGK